MTDNAKNVTHLNHLNYFANSCKDGYGYTCKECANEYNRVEARERYYNNHEEELRKKREYVAANRDRINQRRRERMAKKRAAQRIERQKEIPDMYLDYTDNEGQHQSIKLSELTDEQYKSLYRTTSQYNYLF